MEGIMWLIMCAYLIVGCFYYVTSINRIVSFIKTMNGMSIVNATSLIIVLMALIIAWPYLLWLDIKEQLEAPWNS